MKNLNLMRKYQMIIGVLIVFFVAFMVLITGQLNEVERQILKLNEDDIEVQEIKDIQKDFLQFEIITSDYISFVDEELIADYHELKESLSNRVLEMKRTTIIEEDVDEYDKIVTNIEMMSELFETEIIYGRERNLKVQYMLGKETFNEINDENFILTDNIINYTIQNKENTNAELNHNMSFTKLVVLFLLVLATLLSFSLIYFLTKSTSSRLGKVIELNKQITNKKLNINKLAVKSMDEIGVLSISSNKMIDTLSGIITSMVNVSAELLDQGQKVNDSVVNAKSDSKQIQRTMSELSDVMFTQTDVLNKMVLSITNLEEEIINTNTESRELNRASLVLNELSSKGSKMMDESINSMEKINKTVKNTVDMMNDLVRHTNSITSLTDVINSISEQTNLLSLNAAIEAARAGEAGKGFGVVAGEIRTLAGQVNKAAMDIDSIINTIQSQTENVTNALFEGNSEVENGAQKMNKSAEAYTLISNESSQIQKRANAVDLSMDEIEENVKSVADSISQISAMSQETTASIEGTVEAVNEEDDILTGILSNADELQSIATKLTLLISDFEV